MTTPWPDRRHVRFIAAAVLLLAAAGCAPAKVSTVQGYNGPPLPRPGMVVVTDFAAATDAVTLDRGLGARVRSAVNGTGDATRQSEDERKVADAIANALVKEIQARGLAAMRSNQLPLLSETDRLVVVGRILSIDEGNRTRRNVVGLGAGRSSVKARTEVYYVARGGAPQLVESYDTTAESSRKPGAAETMGVGAASGRVASSAAVTAGTGAVPALSGDVEADGTRMGQAIAKQLSGFFTSQGWTR